DAAGGVTCLACDELDRDAPLHTLGKVVAPRWFSGGSECLVEPAGTVLCSGAIPPAGNGAALRDAPDHRLAGIVGASEVRFNAEDVCTREPAQPWSCASRGRDGLQSAHPNNSMRFAAPELITDAHRTTSVAVHRFALCWIDEGRRATCERRSPAGAKNGTVEIENVRRVVVGNPHACAINTHDELWCFGTNESGQALGVPRPPIALKPTKVLDSVLDVAVGLSHTCAIEQTGQIVCFGDNSRGQLGLKGTLDRQGMWRVPELGETAKQIVAGYEQTCALTEPGHVVCWGAHTGAGDGVRPITGLGAKVLQLAASGRQTCALLEGGTVACWKDNTSVPELIRGSERSIEIAVGDTHACVRTQGGSVRCWGSNEFGQLGRDLPARRIEVRPPHGCIQVDYSIDSESSELGDVAW
ncbi:MAG TPA: hypothetical protein VFQ61_15240, partial [Polyangiaceae bacterium]|nr:hypothetical protein [Polyangiaceae bacterium]